MDGRLMLLGATALGSIVLIFYILDVFTRRPTRPEGEETRRNSIS